MNIKAKNSNDAMKKMLRALKRAKETNPRGLRVKEIINVNLEIENVENDRGFITKHLPVNREYALAEIDLYMSGSRKLKDFAKISKFWNGVSDDGKTIRSAYGYIIFKKHGFNQLQYCIDQLKKDNDSRKAVITYKTPYEPETKDNVCTLSQQFFIRDGKLHTIVNMRSNDIEFGFRNDLPWFIYLANIVAKELNIPLGKYYHNVGSLHAYDRTIKKMGWK